MTVGFPSGGHRELWDESGSELFRRFTARRQSSPTALSTINKRTKTDTGNENKLLK